MSSRAPDIGDHKEENITSDVPRSLEVISKNGLVYYEYQPYTEVLCKPKLLPLKSVTLQQIEEMEKQAERIAAENKAKKGT